MQHKEGKGKGNDRREGLACEQDWAISLKQGLEALRYPVQPVQQQRGKASVLPLLLLCGTALHPGGHEIPGPRETCQSLSGNTPPHPGYKYHLRPCIIDLSATLPTMPLSFEERTKERSLQIWR